MVGCTDRGRAGYPSDSSWAGRDGTSQRGASLLVRRGLRPCRHDLSSPPSPCWATRLSAVQAHGPFSTTESGPPHGPPDPGACRSPAHRGRPCHQRAMRPAGPGPSGLRPHWSPHGIWIIRPKPQGARPHTRSTRPWRNRDSVPRDQRAKGPAVSNPPVKGGWVN